MLVEHFPLVGLRLVTPRLELRLPSPAELAALAALAAAGIHPPERQPFRVPWTDQSPAEVARSVVQHHWSQWGSWAPERWSLLFVVCHAGVVVGQQDLMGHDFAITREVGTGSWLGRRHQGQGLGTEMRAAVLHLAFAGLGAAQAVSAAQMDSAASLGVSRRLGYEPDGFERYAVRGAPAVVQRLRLSRAAWEAHRSVPVTVHGLAPCLPWFGLPAAGSGRVGQQGVDRARRG